MAPMPGKRSPCNHCVVPSWPGISSDVARCLTEEIMYSGRQSGSYQYQGRRCIVQQIDATWKPAFNDIGGLVTSTRPRPLALAPQP